MRDAFGGAFMIKLFLVFIFIYVAFTAIALNYAKAFRVKNKIIDYLETNEIYDLKSISDDGLGKKLTDIDNILGPFGYNVDCIGAEGTNKVITTTDGICYRGVLIERIADTSTANKYVYYKVTTAVDWKLGSLNLLLTFGGNYNDQDPLGGTFQISGESRIIHHE